MDTQDALLSEVERTLKQRYEAADFKAGVDRIPSTAAPRKRENRVNQLLLPDSERSKMPLTKEKFLIRENPQLILWERETRKFLRLLTPLHEHRVSAVMVYEWATGLQIIDLMKLEQEITPERRTTTPIPTWRADLRKIDKALTFYFGKSYMTYIAGRKVKHAYKIRKGYYIYQHRPMTLELWVEWKGGIKL